MAVVLGVLVVLGLVGLAVAAARNSNAGQRDHQTQSDLETVRTLYQKDGALQVHTDTRSSIILRKGEVALFFSVPAAFSEEKAHTRHGGASIRVAKGVRIGGGQSHSIPVVREVDRGDLLLTNRRVVFTGARRTVEVRHSQLDALEFNPTTLLLRKSGRMKAMYFSVAAGYAMVIGELIQYLLAHDDWERMDHGPFPVLVHSGSKHTVENMAAELLAKPEARLAVCAAFLVLVMNADGVVTDEEIEGVQTLEPFLPGILGAVADEIEGTGASVNTDQAIDAALTWPVDERAGLLHACERLADADGRSEQEQETLDGIRLLLQLEEYAKEAKA